MNGIELHAHARYKRARARALLNAARNVSFTRTMNRSHVPATLAFSAAVAYVIAMIFDKHV